MCIQAAVTFNSNGLDMRLFRLYLYLYILVARMASKLLKMRNDITYYFHLFCWDKNKHFEATWPNREGRVGEENQVKNNWSNYRVEDYIYMATATKNNYLEKIVTHFYFFDIWPILFDLVVLRNDSWPQKITQLYNICWTIDNYLILFNNLWLSMSIFAPRFLIYNKSFKSCIRRPNAHFWPSVQRIFRWRSFFLWQLINYVHFNFFRCWCIFNPVA